MADKELSNEEIFERLKEQGIKCGPITNSTRNVYLKKLEKLTATSKQLAATQSAETYTDDQLRAALKIHGIQVGPINSQSVRTLYEKKLKTMSAKSCDNIEPMDVEFDFSRNS